MIQPPPAHPDERVARVLAGLDPDCQVVLRRYLCAQCLIAGLGAVPILAMVGVLLHGSAHRPTWSVWAALSMLGLIAARALTWRALVTRRLRRASDGRCPAVRLRGRLWQCQRLTTDTPMLSLYPPQPAPDSRPRWNLALLPGQLPGPCWRQGDEVILLGPQHGWAVPVVVAGGAVLLPAGPLHRLLPLDLCRRHSPGRWPHNPPLAPPTPGATREPDVYPDR
jgi:hypothetical protein